MGTHQLIIDARRALDALTPLHADCGALCGARCCQSGDNGEGMYLFPTEEYLYNEADAPWARLEPSALEGVTMLACDGVCPREQRPLACRIFPLTPYLKDGRMRIRLDPRARPMCPLYDSGVDGLDARFVQTVRDVMGPLASIDQQRAFMEQLSGEIDAFVRMRKGLLTPSNE